MVCYGSSVGGTMAFVYIGMFFLTRTTTTAYGGSGECSASPVQKNSGSSIDFRLGALTAVWWGRAACHKSKHRKMW